MNNGFRLSTVESVLLIFAVVAIVAGIGLISRHMTAARQARTALARGKEYRRLSDMAITAQEPIGLRLAGRGVRIDEIREQLEQMQRFLKEVE